MSRAFQLVHLEDTPRFISPDTCHVTRSRLPRTKRTLEDDMSHDVLSVRQSDGKIGLLKLRSVTDSQVVKEAHNHANTHKQAKVLAQNS